MRPTTWLSKLGVLLAILGGINWGIIGIRKYKVVKAIFESTGKVLGMTTGERIVYIVAGAGATRRTRDHVRASGGAAVTAAPPLAAA